MIHLEADRARPRKQHPNGPSLPHSTMSSLAISPAPRESSMSLLCRRLEAQIRQAQWQTQLKLQISLVVANGLGGEPLCGFKRNQRSRSGESRRSHLSRLMCACVSRPRSDRISARGQADCTILAAPSYVSPAASGAAKRAASLISRGREEDRLGPLQMSKSPDNEPFTNLISNDDKTPACPRLAPAQTDLAIRPTACRLTVSLSHQTRESLATSAVDCCPRSGMWRPCHHLRRLELWHGDAQINPLPRRAQRNKLALQSSSRSESQAVSIRACVSALSVLCSVSVLVCLRRPQWNLTHTVVMSPRNGTTASRDSLAGSCKI